MRVRGGLVIAVAVALGLVLAGPGTAKKPTPSPPGPAFANADLSLYKVGPTSVDAGNNATYNIQVWNLGPGTATGVHLTDTTPAGMSFVSVSGSAGSVCGAGPNVDCTNASMLPGVELFTVILHVASGTAAGTITNSASVHGNEVDPNYGNNTAATNTIITTHADLQVAKSGPAQIVAGTDAVYSLSVDNIGPSDAHTLILTDTFPAGMSFVSATGGGFSCSAAANVVTCTKSTQTLGFAVVTLTLQEPASTAVGTTRTNSATVTATTADPNSSNNSASTTGTVATQADLGITKTDNVMGPNAGTEMTWTVTVTNHGPSDAQGVVWSDILPAGVGFVSLTQTGTPVFLCTTPLVGATGLVSCSITTLVASGVTAFDIVVEIGQHTTGLLSNTATVATAGTSSLGDPNSVNNSATDSMTVLPASADLAITKTQSTSTPVAGTDFTYHISLTNNGPSDSETAHWSDTLPVTQTFVSRTATNANASAFNCSGTTSTTCTDPSLFEEGTTATWDLVVHIPAFAGGTTYTNVAADSETTADPNSANNTSSATATVIAQADLSVTKTASPSPSVIANSNITYTVTVTNNGPSDAQSVSLADTLPAGTTPVSYNQTTGPAFACTLVVSTGTCTRATFAAGASATFVGVVTANADPNAISPPITNTVNVSSATDDPTPGNNSAQVTTKVIPLADLSVTKTGPAKVHINANATYTITVHNNGPSATDVTLNDVLPGGVHFGSVVQISGPSFSCSAPPPGTASGKVHCTRGTFASGATAVFQVTMNLHHKITNTATVSTSGSDTNSGNDSASATTKVKG